MNKNNCLPFSLALSVVVAMVSFVSCNKQPPIEPIPYKFVNFRINLTNVQYTDLRRDGGAVFVPGEGVRGVIVYRENAQRYLAFESNCTFEPNKPCANVKVDGSLLYMIDSCCNSIFGFDGVPISGPAFYPLLRYGTSMSGDLLFVSN